MTMREIERQVDVLMSTVCIGTVVSVHQSTRTARVRLEDGKSESEDMPVLNRADSWMPSRGQDVAYLLRPGGDGIIIGRLG